MPSWLTPITSEMFSIARSVVRAMREPSSARGSIWLRRAETRANSAPTKNALPSSRSTREEQQSDGSSLTVLGRSSPSSSRRPTRSIRRPSMCSTVRTASCSRTSSGSERSGTGTSATSPCSGTRPSTRSTRPRDGVVVLVVGQLDPGDVLDLVRPQQAGQRPAAVAPLPGPGAEAVVLVGDVADDLLDHVLEGDDAGVAAVLVEDDRHLEAVAAQDREQRVEPHRVRDDDRLRHDVLDLGRGPLVDGQRDRVLHVDGADHVVLAVEHREA